MSLTGILAALDEQIATLKQARALLTTTGVETEKPTRGRPKGSTNALVKKKRNISPEGRARIVAAVKRRWAAQKKGSAK